MSTGKGGELIVTDLGAHIEAEAIPVPKVDALWRRLFAFIVDGVALSVIQIGLNGVFGVERVTSGSPFPRPGSAFTAYSTAWTLDPAWSIAVAVAYFLIQEALFGTTLGKWGMGLCVVDASGGRMTVWQAVLRNVIRPLDGLPTAYSLGALLVLFSKRHQRIGDMVAGTLVVDAASAPLAARAPAELRRNMRRLVFALTVAALLCPIYAYFGRPPLVIESWRNTGQYMFGKPVASYTLGWPQWSWGTVTYPFTYQPAASRGRCQGLMTLQWGVLFGVWTLRSGSSYCGTPNRPTSYYGYGGT